MSLVSKMIGCIGALGLCLSVANAGTIQDKSETISCSQDTSIVKEFIMEAVTGWNMVSLPGFTSYPVEDIFGDASKISAVLYFDSTSQSYKFYKADGTVRDFTWVIPGKGYWLIAKEPFSMRVKLTVPSCQLLGPQIPQSAKTLLGVN